MSEKALTASGILQALSPDERRRVSAILSRSSESLDSVVPSNPDAMEVWEDLAACCRAVSRLERVTAILKPVVGRMLRVMENQPTEFFESKGFRSFGEFMKRGIRPLMGVSTPEGYKLLSLAKKLSSLPPDTYSDIGYTKLNIVARVARDGDSALPQWLEAARNNTTEGLQELVYQSGMGIESGSLEMATVVISTTKAVRDRWKEFIEDPLVRAYCETDSPGSILLRMIEEVTGEWLVRSRGAAVEPEQADGLAVAEVVATGGDPESADFLTFDSVFE